MSMWVLEIHFMRSAHKRIVMNTLFASSLYSSNGPQYAKPKLS